MSVSDNERTFVPAELDVLEDALELPADVAPRVPMDLGDDARDRIHGALIRYRAIERHAQALLREHEPPASVLAAVLAEARAAAAMPIAPPVAPPIAPAPATRRAASWLRALWIVPSVAAIAGAAVVGVIMTRPESSPTAVSPSASQAVARAEAPSSSGPAGAPTLPPLADASTLRREDEGTVRGAGTKGDARLAEAVAAERDAAPDPEPEPEMRRARADGWGDDLAARPNAARPKKTSSDPAGPAVAPGGAAPKSPAPSSPAKPATKNADLPTPPTQVPAEDGAVDRLARADAARRRGDCAAARPDYQRVVTIGTTKQRARARAGLALCLERAGEREAARELFDQARADDAAIDAWISTER
jgi:hypothetical protein